MRMIVTINIPPERVGVVEKKLQVRFSTIEAASNLLKITIETTPEIVREKYFSSTMFRRNGTGYDLRLRSAIRSPHWSEYITKYTDISVVIPRQESQVRECNPYVYSDLWLPVSLSIQVSYPGVFHEAYHYTLTASLDLTLSDPRTGRSETQPSVFASVNLQSRDASITITKINNTHVVLKLTSLALTEVFLTASLTIYNKTFLTERVIPVNATLEPSAPPAPSAPPLPLGDPYSFACCMSEEFPPPNDTMTPMYDYVFAQNQCVQKCCVDCISSSTPDRRLEESENKNWRFSEKGGDCNQACSTHGLSCVDDGVFRIDNNEDFKSAYEEAVKHESTDPYPSVTTDDCSFPEEAQRYAQLFEPYVVKADDVFYCMYGDVASVCDTSNYLVRRLCYCVPSPPPSPLPPNLPPSPPPYWDVSNSFLYQYKKVGSEQDFIPRQGGRRLAGNERMFPEIIPSSSADFHKSSQWIDCYSRDPDSDSDEVNLCTFNFMLDKCVDREQNMLDSKKWDNEFKYHEHFVDLAPANPCSNLWWDQETVQSEVIVTNTFIRYMMGFCV